MNSNINSNDLFQTLGPWLNQQISQYMLEAKTRLKEGNIDRAIVCLQLVKGWKEMKKIFEKELK